MGAEVPNSWCKLEVSLSEKGKVRYYGGGSPETPPTCVGMGCWSGHTLLPTNGVKWGGLGYELVATGCGVGG
jgi:hypothetical protein